MRARVGEKKRVRAFPTIDLAELREVFPQLGVGKGWVEATNEDFAVVTVRIRVSTHAHVSVWR